jgi:hypothetical protein
MIFSLEKFRRNQIVYFGVWGLMLVVTARFAFFGIKAAVRPSHGFGAYYTAARLVKEGDDVSRFYDNDWFRAQFKRYVPFGSDIYNINPPITALLLLPLAGFDYMGARVVWTIFNLMCLIGAVGWLLWQLEFRGLWMPGSIVFVLLYQPIYANFSYGQAYVLLFALLVMAWHGYRHRHEAMLGIALGLMVILKTSGVLLWLLLLVQRRWKALAWSTVVVLAVCLGSLLWLGLEAWKTYFHLLPYLSSRPDMAVTAHQTQLSFFRHLLTFDAQWNPAPLLQVPALGIWLPWVSLAIMVGFSVYWAYKKDRADLVFAAFVVANLVLSPVSLDYHYTLLLVSIAILVAWIRQQTLLWPWIILGIAMALIAANLPYISPQLATGWWALLAYPKLYGAWLLWGLALRACRQDNPVVNDER